MQQQRAQGLQAKKKKNSTPGKDMLFQYCCAFAEEHPSALGMQITR